MDRQTIRNWAPDDRPREKLIKQGASALSDAELISILLGTGTRNSTAVDIARAVLNAAQNDLVALGKLDIHSLRRIKGMGVAKSLNLLAALELGRRRRSSEATDSPVISRSANAFEHFLPRLGDLHHEEFWVMMLSRRNKVIGISRVSEGGISYTAVDPKKVFGIALENKSAAIIVAHNHPSGSTLPSEEDMRLTRKLVMAGKNLELPVIDHLIITQSGYFSFADEGKLESG
ncbi:MAG: repair protein RadC [Bacteroidota bacterium]